MSNEQQELLQNVKTWLDIDNQIRSLQKEIRERRKLKKELTGNLVNIMSTQGIDASKYTRWSAYL